MKEDTTAMLGLRALLGEAPSAPIPEPKVHVAEKTVRSFTSLEDWSAAVKDSGLKVSSSKHGEDDEYFVEKHDDDDVTMIGYFKDNWGMLV